MNKNIKKYYLVNVLWGLSFSAPIFILYYRSFGLSFFQISILESIYFIASLVFEVPTGVLADRYGRKTTVIAGAFFMMLGSLTTGLSGNFSQFALANIAWALGMTLMNGAEDALIFDTLEDDKEEHRFAGVMGRGMSFVYFSGALTAPIGAYLFTRNHHFPYYLDALTAFSAFLIYFTFSEVKKIAPEKREAFRKLLVSGVKNIFFNKFARWYVLFSVVAGIVFNVFHSSLQQPVLVQQGVDVRYIGYVFGAVSLVQALVSYFTETIEKKMGEKTAVALFFLAPSVALLLMRTPLAWFVVISFLVYSASRGFLFPILNGYLQKHLESATRATALSVQSFIGSLAAAIFMPVFGLIADRINVVNTASILGLFLLLFGGILFLNFPQKTRLTALAK